MKKKLKNFIGKFDFIGKILENNIINPVMLRLYIAGYAGNYADFKEAADYEKTAELKI